MAAKLDLLVELNLGELRNKLQTYLTEEQKAEVGYRFNNVNLVRSDTPILMLEKNY